MGIKPGVDGIWSRSYPRQDVTLSSVKSEVVDMLNPDSG